MKWEWWWLRRAGRIDCPPCGTADSHSCDGSCARCAGSTGYRSGDTCDRSTSRRRPPHRSNSSTYSELFGPICGAALLALANMAMARRPDKQNNSELNGAGNSGRRRAWNAVSVTCNSLLKQWKVLAKKRQNQKMAFAWLWRRCELLLHADQISDQLNESNNPIYIFKLTVGYYGAVLGVFRPRIVAPCVRVQGLGTSSVLAGSPIAGIQGNVYSPFRYNLILMFIDERRTYDSLAILTLVGRNSWTELLACPNKQRLCILIDSWRLTTQMAPLMHLAAWDFYTQFSEMNRKKQFILTARHAY